jgi:biopolymer transport protein ExbD
MKRVSNRQLPGLLAEVQVTPLLDLVLMLLLAVLVLVPVLRGGGHADSPSPAAQSPESMLELVVAADLKLTLSGKGIVDQQLIGELKSRVAAEPNLGVLVRVPAELKTPALLQIMEALRSAHVRHTAVTTEPATQP